MPSTHPTFLWLLLPILPLAIGVSTLGCGDSSPDPSAADANPGAPDAAGPHAQYTLPSDFPRDGCTAGQLAGDQSNIFDVGLDYGGGEIYPLVFRFDDTSPGNGIVVGQDSTSAKRFGNDDFVVEFHDDSGDIRAVDVCGKDADGTVHGTYASCSTQDSPPCFTLPFSGKALVPYDSTEAVGMHELGEFGADWPSTVFVTGYSVNVRVEDSIAYVARYEDGLRIVDAHDPAHMTELAHLPCEYPQQGEIYNDVKMVDGTTGAGAGHRYALMASDEVGVVVVDVTTPTAPVIVGHFGTPPNQGDPVNTHTIFIDGGKAYIATYNVGLEIYSITDPTAPVKLGGFNLTASGAYLHDLYVSGNRAYLNFWDNGLAIVDVTDPAHTALLGQFQNYGETTSHSNWVTTVGNRKISIHGDEQWNAHVHIADVTEGTPAFATSIGEFQTRAPVSVHNIMAIGSMAIVAYYQDGVRLLDLSDPTHPTEVGHFSSWKGYQPAGQQRLGYSFYEGVVGIDVDPTSKTIYIADGNRGLIVTHLDLATN